MPTRSIYAISGLLVGAVVNIAINLLSSAIQEHTFNFLSNQTIWGFIIFIILGLLTGYWLGAQLQVPASTASKLPPSSQPASTPSNTTIPSQPDTVTITRLRALLPYGKLKGKGIHLSDILLIG